MRKGFTLIELMIVVAIIGVLSTLVLYGMTGIKSAVNNLIIKIQIAALLRDAEFIHDTYGYYPNDSHASITCPAELEINPVTHEKWGKYISLCNDPYGRPYEWYNRCGNGNSRKPYAPFDPICQSFSDSDPGQVGVVATGVDGVNEFCTGDDICNGMRGFPVYTGVSVSTGSGTPVTSCINNISDCSGLSSSFCTLRTGCSLTLEDCTGSYQSTSSCVGLTQSNCTPSGCSWTPGGSCSGTPPSCSGYSDQTSCGSAGCTWNAACLGTVNCSNYSVDQASCTGNGCTYNTASCIGSVACSKWNATSATTCTTGHPSCVWSAGGGGKCNGTISCPGIATQTACTTATCTWGTASCTGSPSCSGFIPSTCPTVSGCSWSQSCSGALPACSSYLNSTSCIAASGCSWADSSGCQGSYTTNENCNVFTNSVNCLLQPGCTWNTAACAGTALSCTTLTTQSECLSQAGCNWQ